MTLHERLFFELSKTGLPVEYLSPRKGHIPKLPFLVYYRYKDATFVADNSRYSDIEEFYIELYQKQRDRECEQKVEEALSNLGVFRRETETWIDRENCQLTTYKISLVKENN